MLISELSFDDQLDIACDLLYEFHRDLTEEQKFNFLLKQGFSGVLARVAIEDLEDNEIRGEIIERSINKGDAR